MPDFLRQYYISQEYPGAANDLIQNIDQYLKLESLTTNTESTKLSGDLSILATTVNVSFASTESIYGTYQFPEKYGLIQIDNEIILYKSKTDTSFVDCQRGFSGVTSYDNIDAKDQLTFKESAVAKHTNGAKIVNLSALLFQEFLTKIKYQFTPGFEDRELDSELDKRLFISRANDFYTSKGTDDSFKTLFGALYGESVDVIKPKESLFRPSDAQYRVVKDIVVESISGDPSQLLNQTLFQDANSAYGIPKAYAPITDVERMRYAGKEFYKLSVDFNYQLDIPLEGSIFGEFSVHPNTKIINNVAAGATVISVDSTVGFPAEGELITHFNAGINTVGILTYTSKSVNQFFGVQGVDTAIDNLRDIRLNTNAYGYVGIGTTTKVEVRIGSVLSTPIIDEETYYYSQDDTIKIKSLGITTASPRTYSWLYNLATSFSIKSLTLIDASDYTYEVETYTENDIGVRDNIAVVNTAGAEYNSSVTGVVNPTTFSIVGQGAIDGVPGTVKRKLLKPEVSSVLSKYNYIESNTANVQNSYVNFDHDVLIAAPSLPYYSDRKLNFYDRELTLNGSYEGETFTITDRDEHGYYTGDPVYYNNNITETTVDNVVVKTISQFDNMDPGIFYMKRINGTQFKLASSQANLYNEEYISVSGIVTANTVIPSDFHNRILQHQNLIRQFKEPSKKSGIYETEPGKTGMLINGVEILNYKSQEIVYSGTLNSIDIASEGSDYDVINPPILSIQDATGVGATGVVAVKGAFEAIDIIDSGFDYVSKPILTISGGNGINATATVNTKYIDHSVSFNATAASARVNIDNDTIGFSTYHKFRNAEKVIYKTDAQLAVTGLTTDALYYVNVATASTIKLYPTEADLIVGINTVDLTGYGEGVHRIEAFNQKQILSNIVVDNGGENYENKQRSCSPAGINTASDQVNIVNHDYNSRDIIKYSNDSTTVSGLTDDTSYIVTRVDANNFRLSSVGVGTTAKYHYFDTKQYIDFEAIGAGSHVFNYEPITLSLVGEIGVTTFSGQDFNAVLQPIVRGSIKSVQVTDKGSGYGSNIINYNRQPQVQVLSGEDAELLPIVSNGSLQEVLITKGGSGYNSPPTLTVNGEGKYAKLVPIISGGQITKVIIDSPGVGFATEGTSVSVEESGADVNFKSNLDTWTVNLFEKYKDIISADDGVLDNPINSEYGIEYTHLFAPRSLREAVYGKTQDNDIKYGTFDLQKISEQEVNSGYHSPILGWAYDGNPIYGPYGFSTPTGGTIKQMLTGYEPVTRANRPSLSAFSQGFFVEDFKFTDSGSLDRHNGRFCITPDYPTGTYAYFATINPGSVEEVQPFKNYREPVFPYLIGNTYKSEPNEFNFNKDSTQGSYDLNKSNYFRNTTPYFLTDKDAQYDYVFQPNKAKEQTINISAVTTGSIDSVGIITGGSGYRVNDAVEFERGVSNAKSKVAKVFGKVIKYVSVASSIANGLEIMPVDARGSYVAFAATPHNFQNLDLVSLAGFNTSVNYIDNSFNIGISTGEYILNVGVGTTGVTGIVTYFNVGGRLTDDLLSVRENDIFAIGDERVKVLAVDNLNSRVRVLRTQDGTVSAAHTASTVLYEDSRKFTFDAEPENNVTFEINKQIYFNPVESLALGASSGVGIGTTIFFSNPGAGITQVFIETQSIYLPKHGLKTGDTLTYQVNDGDSIGVTTTGSSAVNFYLPNNQTVYAAKLSDNLIGIATVKIGLGATGTYIGIADTTANDGLLYFSGIGTGLYHSFKTVKTNVVTAEASKNTVTVSCGSTHGLSLRDNIDISIDTGITTSIVVKYNDYNRRIVFDPLSFTASDVDTTENTITVSDHGLVNGDKVIHTATTPSGGLVNDKIYYIYRFSKDKVKLTLTDYQTTVFTPKFVDITSASTGTLSPINPKVDVYKNDTVEFNLSDSTLSSLHNSTLYSAFSLDLYSDSNLTGLGQSSFQSQFDSSFKNDYFEVSKVGRVGIDTNAKLVLRVTDQIPENLYYKFTPANPNFISAVKEEIYIDTEVPNYNQVNVQSSKYSGSFGVVGFGTTSFEYNLKETPERSEYDRTTASMEYETSSTSAYGEISDILITYSGTGYEKVVGISTIVSTLGAGAILEPSSDTIGKITTVEIEDIGFDWPTDNTLRPVANLPEILRVDSLTSFRFIGISSVGKDYNIAPKLVVLDGLTGKQVTDVDIFYNIGDTSVTIRNNTYGISNVTPTIVPTSNSNGVGIATVTYNLSANTVAVGLDTAFSDTVPFAVGDKVLIENLSVGVGTTGKGYNSDNYGYNRFTLTDVNIPLGGAIGFVTYSLDGFVDSVGGEIPGNVDYLNSAGRMIAEKDFPQFDIQLKKNNYIIGETVTAGSKSGIVESWNNEIELLKTSTIDELNIGDVIVGKTSRTQSRVREKIDFNSYIKLGPTSIVKKGWRKDTGFLNYDTERLPDNDYYQNFSYSLKSKVSMDEWNDAVSSLNHTSGFLKFSDLTIESEDTNFGGPYSDYSGATVDVVTDFANAMDLNSYSNFDLATENGLVIGTKTISNSIYFNSKVLTDYYESFGNRVLVIDDVSTQFSSEPRAEKFSVVDKFDVKQRSKKYFTFVRDKRYTDQRSVSLVTVIHDNFLGYANNYAKLPTVYDQGYFDFNIAGSEGQLLYYPSKYEDNNYNISAIAFDIDDSISGVGTTAIGQICNIESTQTDIAAGTATTIVSIASTYRSSKIIVEIDGDNGELEFNELSIIHNDTIAEILEYGQMTTTPTVWDSGVGLGTFGVAMADDHLNVNFTPAITGVAMTANTVRVSMSSSESTGIGSFTLGGARENIGLLESHYTSIASTTSPGIHTVASYFHTGDTAYDHSGAYFIVSVEDTTNMKFQMTEVVVVNDSSNAYITQYGDIVTDDDSLSGIGTIGALWTSDHTYLQYTPPASVNTAVRVFGMAIQLVAVDNTENSEINLNNASITAGYGFYYGTGTAVKREFALKHREKDIFKRSIDASDTAIVDLSLDTVTIPEHFFVSGEELVYSYDTTPIGIGTTDGFVGVGTTDLLPRSVFAIKVDDKTLKFATTAENALKTTPVPIDITAVGVGTSHSLTSTQQNTKCLITIDNYCQSPVVATSVTTGIGKSLNITDDGVIFQGITSFFGGDLVKVDDEIMKISTVGYGLTNRILVNRPWMGTALGVHSENAIVTKVDGDYNIVDNTLHLIEAPQGPTPISSTTNPPDAVDWVGITTFSTFQGRSFMRSGAENSSNQPYSENYVFDDIAGKFDAVTKRFTLQSDQENISGFSTNNAAILINGIFQGPTGTLDTDQDYSLGENAGITSIYFTGTATSVSYDPNNANIPVGGIVISVGSTKGFGYQPLVAAGGTALVSTSGTITSIAIGNTGSGYRVGVQTVNVGIQTYTTGVVVPMGIGTAQITNGHITGVAVTNLSVIYKPREIWDVGYTSTTGVTTVTTATPHGLLTGDDVILTGIAFTCDYAPIVGIQSADYNNTAGIMTVTTSSNHGLSAFSTTTPANSSHVVLAGLAMSCAIDAGVSTHIYPRNRDPFYDTSIPIDSADATTITIGVGTAKTLQQYAHTFVSAATSAVIAGGEYSHTFRYAVGGGVTANTGIGYTPSDATYDPVTGAMVLTMVGHGLTTGNTVSFATSALYFACSMDGYGSDHGYPRTTDPVAGIGTTISSVTTDTITVNVGTTPVSFFDVSAATYTQSSGALQLTIGSHSLTAGTNIKILKESLSFKCSADSYSSIHKYPRAGDPTYGGVAVVGVVSATQFSVNVGTSTVPTVYQSGGTMQAAIIAPRAQNASSSKQDGAWGGTGSIEVLDSKRFTFNAGVSTRTHFYNRGGKVNKNLKVVFDSPLSYSDIPLIYSEESPGVGVGTTATVNIVVGQGSSIIDFEIQNQGYAYGANQILTVPIGGATGIPTDPSLTFDEFQLSIQKIASDSFAGWHFGQVEMLDLIQDQFNGIKKQFVLKLNGSSVTIRAAAGSAIDVQSTLLVFINDILQLPNESYTLTGGSVLTFDEAPKGANRRDGNDFSGDTCKILFYKGSGDTDVIFKDILETVKPGDDVTMEKQDERLVMGVPSSDTAETNPYEGIGIDGSPTNKRVVTWTKQRADKIINGQVVSKSRVLNEALIQPTTNIIQSVGIGSTEIYVENVKTFFDSDAENTTTSKKQKITLTSQNNIVGASATAVVSVAGTVSSITIGAGGTGYTSAPSVSIETPVGLGTTARAEATSTLTGDTVSAITVTTAGVGYTRTSIPQVLIQTPKLIRETNTSDTYTGDFGEIVGITSTTVGVASTGYIFDLFIPIESSLRNTDVVGTAITVSTLAAADYFVVNNSNVGSAVTSLYQDSSILGIGTQFLDNVYEVATVSTATTAVAGVGITYVRRVTVSVEDLGDISGIGLTEFYGDFSWGKITLGSRTNAAAFDAYTRKGTTGVSTGAIVTRVEPLKYQDYS